MPEQRTAPVSARTSLLPVEIPTDPILRARRSVRPRVGGPPTPTSEQLDAPLAPVATPDPSLERDHGRGRDAGLVTLVFWPLEADKRRELAQEGRPRLLLLGSDTPPPTCSDRLEEWVREPFDGIELAARVARLEARARLRARHTYLDPDGVLHSAGARAVLSDAQVPLVAELVDRFDQVVRLDTLVRAYGTVSPSPSPEVTVRAIQRCRVKLGSIGLRVCVVRSKGYLLCLATDP